LASEKWSATVKKKVKRAEKKRSGGRNDDLALREHVVKLLKGGQAHVDFAGAIADFPADKRSVRAENLPHTAWQLLEHLRIAQWDILEFSRNPKHKSPDFPEGYWPRAAAPPDEKAWDKSLQSFRADLEAMCKLVEDESTDLFAKIPHGDGQTILREALLVADHNAYHLGEAVLLRRVLGAWH
jgi:hypothetical protein